MNIVQLETETVVTIDDKESRKARYLSGIKQAEGGFLAAAQAFCEMEAKGDDISFVRHGLRQVLRAIGGGRMLPECYTNFKGPLQRMLMQMPMDVQRDVISGAPLPLVIIKPDGQGVETLQVQAQVLEPIQIRQIFGKEAIRTEGEQRVWIEAQQLRRKPLPSTVDDPVTVNRKRDGIDVNGIFICKKALLGYMMELD